MSLTVETDVVIVGAGLVGLSAAMALHDIGKRVVLLDAKQPDFSLPTQFDQRIYAITPGNVQWLRGIQVWDKVDKRRVNSIHCMRLWHEDATIRLDSMDAHLPDLGVIVEQQNLMCAFNQRLKDTGLETIFDAPPRSIENNEDSISLTLSDGAHIVAQLLIGADSARSWVRDSLGISTRLHDFEQTAIVANFKASKPHHDAAYQWFRPHETLALLPMPDQHVSLVWALSTQSAQQKLILSAEELAESIGQVSDNILGNLVQVTEATAFPLKQVTATRFVAQRAVLVGDAAHQVHPMAGQGVNLGFRDVIRLVQELQETHGMIPLGDAQLLRRYERGRKADVLGMHILTTGLDTLFAMHNTSLQTLAQWSFKQVGQHSWMKKRLIRQAVI
ncbi:MAG TPA: FAD-dependent monooxygenase [Methylophilus sp.]|nr:FAD-dependent monooxygenase [Methylophilus sp.]